MDPQTKTWEKSIIYHIKVKQRSLQISTEYTVEPTLCRLMSEISNMEIHISDFASTLLHQGPKDITVFDMDFTDYYNVVYPMALLEAFVMQVQKGSKLWDIIRNPHVNGYGDIRSILFHKRIGPFSLHVRNSIEEILKFEQDPDEWIRVNTLLVRDQTIAQILATAFDATYTDENDTKHKCKFVIVESIHIDLSPSSETLSMLDEIYSTLMRENCAFVVFIIRINVDVYRGYSNAVIRSSSLALSERVRDHIEFFYRSNPYRTFCPMQSAPPSRGFVKARVYIDNHHLEACFERTSPTPSAKAKA